MQGRSLTAPTHASDKPIQELRQEPPLSGGCPSPSASARRHDDDGIPWPFPCATCFRSAEIEKPWLSIRWKFYSKGSDRTGLPGKCWKQCREMMIGVSRKHSGGLAESHLGLRLIPSIKTERGQKRNGVKSSLFIIRWRKNGTFGDSHLLWTSVHGDCPPGSAGEKGAGFGCRCPNLVVSRHQAVLGTSGPARTNHQPRGEAVQGVRSRVLPIPGSGA